MPQAEALQYCSEESCRKRLDFFLRVQKKGVAHFYKNGQHPDTFNLGDAGARASRLVKSVVEGQLLGDDPQIKELAKDLAVLALYDIAILIDSFLGNPLELIEGHHFGGITRLGTELHKKILKPLVLGETPMENPLLAMVITEGIIQGEKRGLVEKVIINCVNILNNERHLEADSIASQFSCVRNYEGAGKMLEGFNNHSMVGNCVSYQNMHDGSLLGSSTIAAYTNSSSWLNDKTAAWGNYQYKNCEELEEIPVGIELEDDKSTDGVDFSYVELTNIEELVEEE
ncbi:hypothetical protein C7212DRAFT_363723 [Tuber magnatum]|uniref:Uncharacterized protein n=1 Tax=Tuber magnatum TaxID=42249 RepID=A0A317SQM8_9PEZI|nr:hypothetical protein C7212DRAFT_363723 [Tuber magnatum]